MNHHADLFDSIPYAKVSFESPPPSRSIVQSLSPSLNAKYDDWVCKMRNWTSVVHTPESKVDISETQRNKRSGLDSFSVSKKTRLNASYQGQSFKVANRKGFCLKSHSLNESKDHKWSKSSTNGTFLSRIKMVAKEGSGLQSPVENNERYVKSNDQSSRYEYKVKSQVNNDCQIDDDILFFNDDIQEIYGSDCELY